MDRLKWVDGLRGIAAFVVAFNHYLQGSVLAPYRSFWDQPRQDNRLILQLFPFRFVFAVYAMVPLFMTLGGYASSMSLLRIRDQSGPSSMLPLLQRTLTRRYLRIYIPVFILAVVSQTAHFLGFIEELISREDLAELQPWISPAAHLHYVLRYCIEQSNVVQLQWNQGLNNQCWTIPMEMRGSCVLSVLILTLASWKRHLRLSALAVALISCFWFGHWDTFCFVGGLSVAEYQLIREGKNKENGAGRKIGQKLELARAMSAVTITLLLVGGLYLICIDGVEELPPGYRFLKMFQSRHWTTYQVWDDVRFNWQAVGSVLVVFAVSRSRSLQKCLERQPFRFLGEISFSIYLVHVLVYRIDRPRMIRLIKTYLKDWVSQNYDEDRRWDMLNLYSSLASGLILGPVILYAAKLHHEYIDRYCATWARQLERLTRGEKASETSVATGKAVGQEKDRSKGSKLTNGDANGSAHISMNGSAVTGLNGSL